MGVLDKNQFNEKLEMLSEEIMAEVILIFFDSWPERKNEIEEAMKEDNSQNLEFAAHALKNDLAQLGVPGILSDSQDFLEKIRQGETRLESTFETLKKDIENHLIPELKEWHDAHKA
ncbi:MAG: Hpt domain-containing protein [Bacteroidales bacterium]|nr:Hpt domain-containing protein [Bacteroidales bacterium]MCF8336483.1 Hpt domain-containing protein [Bacteroidales bacterium]